MSARRAEEERKRGEEKEERRGERGEKERRGEKRRGKKERRERGKKERRGEKERSGERRGEERREREERRGKKERGGEKERRGERVGQERAGQGRSRAPQPPIHRLALIHGMPETRTHKQAKPHPWDAGGTKTSLHGTSPWYPKGSFHPRCGLEVDLSPHNQEAMSSIPEQPASNSSIQLPRLHPMKGH
ncbi:nst1, partial [Ophiophagus hannah]